MLITLLTLALSVPNIDIFQSPPNAYVNQQYTFACDMYGNARRSFHGSGLHTVYVGNWNQAYTIPYDDWTLMVTGAGAYDRVEVMPEPTTLSFLIMGIILKKVRK